MATIPDSSSPSAIKYETHGHNIIMEISVLELACCCFTRSCSTTAPYALLDRFCPISAYSLPKALWRLSMNAMRRAAVAPMRTEPVKTTKNWPKELRISVA